MHIGILIRTSLHLLVRSELYLCNPDILPPIAKKQRGRPKTKRIRKGAWKRKETHCSNCNEPAQNIRKCPNALALNGRQQRARNRELSSNSSSISSNTDSDSSDLSNLNSEDIQFRAEMDQYDEILARV